MNRFTLQLKAIAARMRLWFPRSKPVVEPVTARRDDETPSKRTISDLLEGIGNTFDALESADISSSSASVHTRHALRRVGPYVPDNTTSVCAERIALPEGADWPGLVFVGLGSEETSDDFVPGCFLYAIKTDAHWSTNLHIGPVYEMGASYRLDGKLMWLTTFVQVDAETGVARLLPFQRREVVRLPNGSSYTRNVPTTYDFAEGGSCVEFFHLAMNFWLTRHTTWNVVVRRGDSRLTIAIDTRHTKTFFKDRGLTAEELSTGTRKRIVHYVSAHTRTHKNGTTSTVREHIRGVRQFRWNGYHCNVISPHFGAKTAGDFTGSSVIDDGQSSSLSFVDFAGLVAKQEDQRQPNVTELDKAASR